LTAARDLDEEIAYLRSQRLARVATVSNDGQPDVVPVGYEFDGTHLYVGGLDPVKNRRFRNVQPGTPRSRSSSTTWYPPNHGHRATSGSMAPPSWSSGSADSGRHPIRGSRPPYRGAGTWKDADSPTTARSWSNAPSMKLPLSRVGRFAPPDRLDV